MNKHLFCYSIWNKKELIQEIVYSIITYINPYSVSLLFLFDNCTDGSFEEFREYEHKLRERNYISTGLVSSREELFEVGCHYLAQDLCLETKHKSLIMLQDDMLINQYNFIENIDKVMSTYKEQLGIIGCRDGFNTMYKNAIGSSWSEPKENRVRDLRIGEHEEVKVINFGPVVYPFSTIEKVGFINKKFVGYYADADYSLRCINKGLINIVLGTDMVHRESHVDKGSKIHNGEISKKDLETFVSKYGGFI